MGFMAAKHLFVANAIGIFEKLEGAPATLDELAAKCAVPRRTLRISADAMVSLDLLEREGERYRKSAAAAAFLAGRAGPDLRPAMRLLDRISYPTWIKLEDAVRHGEGQRHLGHLPRRNSRSSRPASKRSLREWRRRSPKATISAAIAACSMSAAGQARS
jgi:hypothetical protein